MAQSCVCAQAKISFSYLVFVCTVRANIYFADIVFVRRQRFLFPFCVYVHCKVNISFADIVFVCTMQAKIPFAYLVFVCRQRFLLPILCLCAGKNFF